MNCVYSFLNDKYRTLTKDRDLSATHLSWVGVEKLSLTTIFKMMVGYVAVTAIATNSISLLRDWGWTNVGLPFNWQVMFFSSLAYIIGYLIYFYKCPTFIKEYPSFKNITSSSYTQNDYRDELNKIINSCEESEIEEEILEFLTVEKNKVDRQKLKSLTDENFVSAISKYREYRTEIELSKELYNSIINKWSKSSPSLSCFTASLIYLSYSLLAITLLCNIWSVIKYLIKPLLMWLNI